MKKLFAGFLLMLSISAASQQFKVNYDVALPDSLASIQPVWADMDNDGLLDVLLLSTSKQNRNYLQWIKGDTLNSPALKLQAMRVITEITAFRVTDYDRDNKLDVVLSGLRNSTPITVVYINMGSFDFIEKIVGVAPFDLLQIADLDNDARQEWIVSGIEGSNYFLRILKQDNALSWTVVHDSLAMHALSIEVLDANNDGFADLFLSGTLKPDSVVSAILVNDGKLSFRPTSNIDLGGLTSTADTNGDGLLDVMLMGNDKQNFPQTFLFESNNDHYDRDDQDFDLRDGLPFVADLNSDGTADRNFTGVTLSGDTLDVNVFSLSSHDTLDSKGLVTQSFGDMDIDGDLDLLKLTKQKTNLHLLFLENTITNRNRRPQPPTHATATQVFGRTFVFWNKPADDHTATASITYDLHLEGASTSLTSNFDLLNEKRLLVTQGNNGTENFALLRDVVASNIQFAVQAVDNSLYPSAVCTGIGCSTPATVKELTACSNESIALEAPKDSYWFSFANGYLGYHKNISAKAINSDTIFYYNPAVVGCGSLVVWTIGIRNDTLKTEVSDKYACSEASLTFTVESGWSQVSWKSMMKGDLGTGLSIQYPVSQPDSVFVTLSNGKGCTIVRKTAVKISKPDVKVAEQEIDIQWGGSGTMSASGADRYVWVPSMGLDHDDVPSPVVTPSVGTNYTVTGYDSLGCSAQAVVLVNVSQTAFVPTLFTPNGDNANDQLRIYGLPPVTDFKFNIYNREGSLVFSTTNVSEATQRGWDGMKSGVRQPSGVYYWKVSGNDSSGHLLTLNNREDGTVVLVR